MPPSANVCKEVRELIWKHHDFRKDIVVKIGDFGLTKSLNFEETTATSCGTTNFMAPEVMNNLGYDHKADVWSIGALSFELITGYHLTSAYPGLANASQQMNNPLILEHLNKGIWFIPQEVPMTM